MSEKEPTQFPKEERGRPVLISNGETGNVDVLRTAGVQYQGEVDGKVHTTEVVGIQSNTNEASSGLGGTQTVENLLLQPEAQEDLARELSELPLRSDTVNGLFDGKIVDVLVGDHKIDETTGKTMIEVTSKETGDSKWADIRAFSPEIQAKMEADKETRNAKLGGGTLESLEIREPNEQTTDSAEKPQLTAAAEVAELPIEAQRAVKDYELYMSSADRSVQANGYNRDAEQDRMRAQGRIDNLPTAMQDLANRYYKELKES